MAKAYRHPLFVTVAVASLWLWPNPSHAGHGCCSAHGGVAGCAGAKLQCSDGTLSPSCSCEKWNVPTFQAGGKKKPVPQIGKDILVKNDPKQPVHVENLRPEIQDTLGTVVDAWKEHGLPTPVITSGNDGQHPGSGAEGTNCSTEARCRQTSDSSHYQNRAVDLRANNISTKDALKLRDELQSQLGDAYTVLFHGAHDNAHIHIQYNHRSSEKGALGK